MSASLNRYKRSVGRFVLQLALWLLLLPLASCGGGGSSDAPSTDDNPISDVQDCEQTGDAGRPVSLSGTLTFDRVPLRTSPRIGLDYTATLAMPIRSVRVEAIICGGQIADSTISDAEGNYALQIPAGARGLVRVKALAESTEPGHDWSIAVRDNTSRDALYVFDDAASTNNGSNELRDIHITSGWTGSNYGEVRAAAPFAILDTIYTAVLRVQQAMDSSALGPLAVFWSVNNRLVESQRDDAAGELPSTFYEYNAGQHRIFVLGEENVDTDEYDEAVLLHEWSHFMAARMSRDDSMGGAHGLNQALDPRIAYSEGFSNAFAAILADNPIYIDSSGVQQNSFFGLVFDLENNQAFPGSQAGWFSEVSVGSIIYDLYDLNSDGADELSLPLAAFFSILDGPQRNTAAMVTLFPFIYALQQAYPEASAGIDSLLRLQGIDPVNDDYGSEQHNWSGLVLEGEPSLQSELALDGSAQQICLSQRFGNYNKLANRRLLRFSLPSDQRLAFRLSRITGQGSNPYLGVFRNGEYRFGFVAQDRDALEFTETLQAGDYILELSDDANLDPDNVEGVEGCYDVSIRSA